MDRGGGRNHRCREQHWLDVQVVQVVSSWEACVNRDSLNPTAGPPGLSLQNHQKCGLVKVSFWSKATADEHRFPPNPPMRRQMRGPHSGKTRSEGSGCRGTAHGESRRVFVDSGVDSWCSPRRSRSLTHWHWRKARTRTAVAGTPLYAVSGSDPTVTQCGHTCDGDLSTVQHCVCPGTRGVFSTTDGPQSQCFTSLLLPSRNGLLSGSEPQTVRQGRAF
jgi:hypothetical protein